MAFTSFITTVEVEEPSGEEDARERAIDLAHKKVNRRVREPEVSYTIIDASPKFEPEPKYSHVDVAIRFHGTPSQIANLGL